MTQNTSAHLNLTDASGRRITYLRVSVTDRCNYACSYCRPGDTWQPAPKSDVLSMEELARFCEWMVENGVQKIRITGGEPLIRSGVTPLVRRLKAIPGLKEIAMTTNGHLLSRYAQELKDAGLDRLNISLDTLNAAAFKTITGGGTLSRVLGGIEAALDAGFKNTRVNAVLLPEISQQEREQLVDWCWQRDVTPAFIEMMPIGGLGFQTDRASISAIDVIKEFRTKLPIEPEVGRNSLSGPVRWWRVKTSDFGWQRLGTISPMSDAHFCESCNRGRLSATGGFRGCLGNDNEVQLLHSIRAHEKYACMKRVLEALNQKRASHLMNDPSFIPLSVMTGIGG